MVRDQPENLERDRLRVDRLRWLCQVLRGWMAYYAGVDRHGFRRAGVDRHGFRRWRRDRPCHRSAGADPGEVERFTGGLRLHSRADKNIEVSVKLFAHGLPVEARKEELP